MPLFNSRCSAARKIYYTSAAKNSYEEIKPDPLFGGGESMPIGIVMAIKIGHLLLFDNEKSTSLK